MTDSTPATAATCRYCGHDTDNPDGVCGPCATAATIRFAALVAEAREAWDRDDRDMAASILLGVFSEADDLCATAAPWYVGLNDKPIEEPMPEQPATAAGRCWPWRPHKWARWERVIIGLWDGEEHVGDRSGQRRACLRCGKEQVRRVRG